MGSIVEREIPENVGVESVGVEYVVILHCQRDNAPAYLILGNLDAENFLVGEGEFVEHKHVAVVLLEFPCEIE